MHFWEELEDCKYEENEYLVDYLIEIVKDEKIDSLEDLQAYEDKYFTESNMSREDWVKWYEESFEHLSEIDEMINDDVALKVKQLRSELEVTNDIELKINNIVTICALLEKEVCFVVELYNLIMGDTNLPKKVVNVNDNRNIVICGSMKVKDDILKNALVLQSRGFDVLLPEECMRGESKKIASRAHFDRIANPDNKVVLIINVTKNGIDNYIGPNSLAEIAMAFYYNKRIYLLNDIYEPYKDELLGWGVIPLKGDFDNIK